MNTAPALRASKPLNGLPRTCIRHASKKKHPVYTTPEGHGEKIWVWTHRRTDQTIYTLRDRLNDHHDLKQLAYNGKKLKPSSLRKDYWSPMAWINFPAGHGEVGRSVFQKLRELKHLHEVSWPTETLYKTRDELTDEEREKSDANVEKGKKPIPYTRTKHERGVVLNAQKKNSIADMAVILAGEGPGNKINLRNFKEDGSGLAGVTVRWANNFDRNYAAEWSNNVAHEFVQGEDIIRIGADGKMVALERPQFEPELLGTTATTAEKGSPRGAVEATQ